MNTRTPLSAARGAIAIASLVLCSALHAQVVISNHGGTTVLPNHTISWSVGEPITGTGTTATGHMTQGYQQPTWRKLRCALIGTSFCANGAPFNLVFTTSATHPPGNVFTAQLSDATGSFANPVAIGSLAGQLSASIACAIPVGTPAGAAYRIRVVSSAPVITGSANNTDLAIATPATWYVDADNDGLGDPGTATLACAQPPGYVTNGGDACPALFGNVGDACDDGDPLTQNDAINASCICTGTGVVRVALRALLDGPYEGMNNRMRDDLRVAGLLPAAQPYAPVPFGHTGTETVTPAVLANPDPNNAIVDWVLVELRDATIPSLILHRRAALIQRDGDVVDIDGTSPVAFLGASAGGYHVSLRHRNHLGAMTATAIALAAPPTAIDLTTAATWGAEGQKARNGRQMLWAGNARADDRLRYTGSSNDRDPILIAVGGFVPTAVLPNVYRLEDTNMDGMVKYTNTNNDRELILINVNWGLVGTSVTRQRLQQLP